MSRKQQPPKEQPELTGPEHYGIGPSLPPGLTAFDLILPPRAAPLLLLLVLILPLVALTAESLLLPVWEMIKTKLVPGGQYGIDRLPFQFYFKLGAFLLLSFFGAFQLLMRINTIYYAMWSRIFPRPHPLHVDYAPDRQQSIISLMSWKLYRLMMILLPPVMVIGITIAAGALELYFFSSFNEQASVSLSIQFTIGIFIMLMLGMFSVFAVLNAVWNTFTTVFGDVIAITEPDLPNQFVYDRCNRVAFSSRFGYFLFPLYFLFIIALVAEIAWLLIAVDIQDFITFQANYGAIFGLELLTFAVYYILNFGKCYTYHYGLVNYYRKLPQQLKDCFDPPPRRDSNFFAVDTKIPLVQY